MNRTLRAATRHGGVLAAAVSSCSGPTSQESSQNLTDIIAKSATDPGKGGVAYPLSEMQAGGWMEEKMLREHLIRQANPNATRYVVVVTQTGQIMGNWPIQGMVVDPNSQMTATDFINTQWSGNPVTHAPGDNGTWGPEAGGAFFFTTSGAEIQIPQGAIWFESDVPLGLTSQPLLTYNQSAQPTVNGGGVKMGGR